MPRLGIVLPVFNEARIMAVALEELSARAPDCPVVVVDGGSSDQSATIARRHFETLTCPNPNRGAQMNLGAARLDSDIFLFLHIDASLPSEFEGCIEGALEDPSIAGGCFQLRFDHPHPLLRFYSWCTRFPGRFLHFGDQAFFVRREVFRQMGGYRELPFLEDVDFLRRLGRYGRFVVLPSSVVTSARRFLRHGIVLQQLTNIAVVALFELGVPAQRLTRLYPHVR
ncbi:MAG: TIGR04283 family arsenosugar biosynthesis glycosyltransferase [Gammaproteobacteria bacterium]